MTSGFFNPDDGLTVQGEVVEDAQDLTGYFDIIDADFYMDDGAATTRGEFVCEVIYASKSLVGKTLRVDGVDYRINQYKPDGAGLVTLVLLSKE